MICSGLVWRLADRNPEQPGKCRTAKIEADTQAKTAASDTAATGNVFRPSKSDSTAMHILQSDTGIPTVFP